MTALPVLDAAAVAALSPAIDVRGALNRLFLALHQGRAVQPAQTLTLFPDGSGDFITYSGALQTEGAFGVKLSPYIAGDPALITAWTLLMSARTGEPLILCDSKALTTERTAGTTALAVDLLAPKAYLTLALIGTGPVGEAHLRHVLPLRDWTDIRLFSPSAARLGRSPLTALDARARLCSSAAEACQDADVILLCTSSAGPVIDPASLTRPALITSISTNAPKAHEIPPSSLKDLTVYCDHRPTTPASAGEMILAADQGWSPDAIAGDLAELVGGVARQPLIGRSTFFRSIGLGLEDIAMACALLDAHRALP